MESAAQELGDKGCGDIRLTRARKILTKPTTPHCPDSRDSAGASFALDGISNNLCFSHEVMLY